MNISLKTFQQKNPTFLPRIAIILGSGLSMMIAKMETLFTAYYEDLIGVSCTTAGHLGQLRLGFVEDVPVACLQGRPHYYEGSSHRDFYNLFSLLKKLGCESIFITNAAGSLIPDQKPGSLMLIRDHINFQGQNPLVGLAERQQACHFIDMKNTYDKTWRKRIKQLAKDKAIPLHEGIYIATLGPCFETPAEIQAFKHWGAEAVGMSTVPEVIMARFFGMRVAAISAISNFASGISDQTLSHELTLKGVKAATQPLSQLTLSIIKDFSEWNG